MLKKIKSIFSKTSEEVSEKEQVSQKIDKTCAALIIEVALADKIFDESEVNLLKEMLLKAYTLEADDIEELIVLFESLHVG